MSTPDPQTTAPDGAAGSPPAAEPVPGDRAGGAGAGSTPRIAPDPRWPLTPDYAGVVTARQVSEFEEKRFG